MPYYHSALRNVRRERDEMRGGGVTPLHRCACHTCNAGPARHATHALQDLDGIPHKQCRSCSCTACHTSSAGPAAARHATQALHDLHGMSPISPDYSLFAHWGCSRRSGGSWKAAESRNAVPGRLMIALEPAWCLMLLLGVLLTAAARAPQGFRLCCCGVS